MKTCQGNTEAHASQKFEKILTVTPVSGSLEMETKDVQSVGLFNRTLLKKGDSNRLVTKTRAIYKKAYVNCE